MPRVTNIQQRGGTAAQWTAANPVLAAREIGLEADTLKLKWGDGTTAWNSLPYFSTPAHDFSNLWKSPYFLPETGGVNGLGTLYSGAEVIPAGNAAQLAVRDHIGKDKFPMMPGDKFVIEFTGKSILGGTLTPNVGVWMQTASGVNGTSAVHGWNSYDGASGAPTKLADLANGFARYRRVHTVSTAAAAAAIPPRLGQLYFQLGQFVPYTDAWIVSDVSIRRVLTDAEISGLTKASVGLGSVDNTSDLAKPISTLTQTALNGKSDTTHTHSAATSGAAGFMPAADKAKLDGAASGLVNSTLVIRDSAGNFSAATPSAAAHVATKGYVDALPAATSSTPGLMPAADKALLDNRATGLVVSTLVARDSNGVFSAGTPTAAAHVATKGYVDDGAIRGSAGKQYREVGCVIRFNSTTGVFEFISDAGHVPVGCSSLETYSDRIVLNYSFTGSKVITAHVTPDEKLAQQGFTMGPSVGTSSMIIYVGQGGFGDYVTATGSTFTSLNGFVTGMSRSTTTWTFTHDYVDGPISGQASYRGGAYQAIAEGLGNTTTNVSLWSATSGAQVNPSAQGSGTSYSFWIMRGGTRRVNPLTDLNLQYSNLWISALLEV